MGEEVGEVTAFGMLARQVNQIDEKVDKIAEVQAGMSEKIGALSRDTAGIGDALRVHCEKQNGHSSKPRFGLREVIVGLLLAGMAGGLGAALGADGLVALVKALVGVGG